MPTNIYDSSYLTFRKRAAVLSSYNTNLNTYRLASPTNYNLVRRAQPTQPVAEVLLSQKQGGCFCTQDASGVSIQPNAPGACSCGR